MNSVDQALLLKQLRCCSATLADQAATYLINGNKDAECFFKQLELLNDYIEALECYRAPLEVTEYVLTGLEDTGQTLIATTTTTEYDNCLSSDDADTIADEAAKICKICD